MKKILSLFLAAALVFCFTGCAVIRNASADPAPAPSVKPEQKAEETESKTADPEKAPQQEAGNKTEEPENSQQENPENALKPDSMTLREKVGMLFMITPQSLCFDPSSGNALEASLQSVNDQMRETYAQYPCGGFCLFADNISDPQQVRKFSADLHSLSDNPVVISVDEEGGKVSRISGKTAFGIEKIPPMEEIAKTGDAKTAFDLGVRIGTYLKDLGFDLDLAPVADVNTNPANPVIGSRAFGSDPQIAAKMVSAELDGLASAGVMGCIKHFPGHGDTSTDTHTGFAKTDKTWEEILSCEMIPFEAGIEEGTRFVMVAHIAAPAVTGGDIPSSLSEVIVTDKLRNELGYDGVVITDALNMGAISNLYSSEDAAIMAIEAGCDVLLMPQNYKKAFDGVLKAVESGRISEKRIDESVARILNAL